MTTYWVTAQATVTADFTIEADDKDGARIEAEARLRLRPFVVWPGDVGDIQTTNVEEAT